MNRQRQKLRPTEPKDLEFEPDEAHIPYNFLRADVRVLGRRRFILATEQQMGHIIRAKSWYIDGTFKLRRHHFSQLLTVNAFVRTEHYAKQVPLLFVLINVWPKEDWLPPSNSCTVKQPFKWNFSSVYNNWLRKSSLQKSCQSFDPMLIWRDVFSTGHRQATWRKVRQSMVQS